jgi:DNA-binding protein H-NS
LEEVMAKDMDLDQLDLEELKGLAKNIEKEIRKRTADNLKKAREAAEAATRQFGFSLEEITGSKPSSRKAGSSDAKYRNPADPSQSWSGRGRQPRWFKDELSSGRALEDLAV